MGRIACLLLISLLFGAPLSAQDRISASEASTYVGIQSAAKSRARLTQCEAEAGQRFSIWIVPTRGRFSPRSSGERTGISSVCRRRNYITARKSAVTGLITSYRGTPQIVVSEPVQIQIGQ